MDARTPSSAPGSSAEEALLRAHGAVKPSAAVQKAIKHRMEARMAAPALLRQAARAVRPDQAVMQRIWSHISPSIDPLSSLSLWDRIRQALEPSALAQLSIREQVLRRLHPAPAPAYAFAYRLKWVAAVFLFVFALRLSPLLFIAPQSVAQSPVLVLPTRGEISVLIGGLWQPLRQDLTLTKSALLQTSDGEATIVLHDDAIVRMAPGTTVALHDLFDPPQLPTHDRTLTLHRGTVWVQSLIPEALPGITVAVGDDRVQLNEGSASITVEGIPAVTVWDRHAMVIRGDARLTLLSGEKSLLHPHIALAARAVAPSSAEDTWIAENQGKDARHRQDLAHVLLERRAAVAGILPTSGLYAMKRVAEEMDVLLTLSPQGKVQKRIDQANTRLNEAAALLKEGNPDASEPLREYQDTLLSVAAIARTDSGSGINQALVQQEVAEAAAGIVAALPSDTLYPVKETVIRTGAALSGSIVPEMQVTMLVDRMAAIRRVIEERGDLSAAKEDFRRIKEQLTVTAVVLPPQARDEVVASFNTLGFTLGEEALPNVPKANGGTDGAGTANAQAEPPSRHLTPAERRAKAERIYGHIEQFDLSISRQNQTRLDLSRLEDDPNRGPILRELKKLLEEQDPSLVPMVVAEMEKARRR